MQVISYVSIHLFVCAFCNIALKKTLDRNAKILCAINSKNVHKKLLRTIEHINFLSDKEKCINYDETLLPNKFHHAHQTSHVTLRYERIIWVAADRSHSQHLYDMLWSFIYWSVVKVFLYNYCLTRLRSQTAASTSESSDPFIVTSAQVMYYIWNVLLSVASPTFLNDI